jgi:hypothetical protein
MAFIRRREVNGATYYSLVESRRESGKVRQRVIASLGQSRTIDDAIDVCRGWVSQYRHNAELRGGRQLFDNGNGRYCVLVCGADAARRADKLEAKLALLLSYRAVVSKTGVSNDRL